MTQMTKARLGSSRSHANTKAAPKNFADYSAGVPEPARRALNKMRDAIRAAAPREAIETISYGIPAFKSKNGVLVWFAAFQSHCSLFPTASVIEGFREELKGFSTSKGTIHFPLDKPLPVTLIKNIVKARVNDSESKKRR